MIRTQIPATAGELKIRHVGFLEMPEFYRWLKRWFELKGYWKPTNEKLYSEIIMPNGKKIDINWECTKERTKYFVYHINVVFLFIGVNKVEVQQEDKKVKVEKGDFEIRIKAYVEKVTPGNTLWKLYEKVILKKNVEDYVNDLADIASSLQDSIKSIFDQYVQ